MCLYFYTVTYFCQIYKGSFSEKNIFSNIFVQFPSIVFVLNRGLKILTAVETFNRDLKYFNRGYYNVYIVVYRGSLVVYNVVLGDEGNPRLILVHTSVPANVAPETRDGKREPDLYLPGSAA